MAEYAGPTLPPMVPADPVRRVDAETGEETLLACHRVVACGHTWTETHLVAYRGAGIRVAVGCENCRAALFDSEPGMEHV